LVCAPLYLQPRHAAVGIELLCPVAPGHPDGRWHPLCDSQNDHYSAASKRSVDLGASWEASHFFFSEDQFFVSGLRGAAAGDTIALALFHSSDHGGEPVDSIETAISPDNGATWSHLRSAVLHHNDNYGFSLAWAGGRLHLAYQDRATQGVTTEIWYTHSADEGRTWHRPRVVSDDSINHSQFPHLSASPEGGLVVSWYDYKYGDGGGGFTGDILYRVSADAGSSWGAERRLTSHHLATETRSFVRGNTIGIVWVDHRTGFFTPELYYAESTDFGATWEPEVRLTEAEGISASPELILEDGYLLLVWLDGRHEPPFGEEIYFRRANDVAVDVWNDEITVPRAIGISAYPNPFNASVTIHYTIGNPKGGELAIYNLLGERIERMNYRERRE
jgi:hypothetical protein